MKPINDLANYAMSLKAAERRVNARNAAINDLQTQCGLTLPAATRVAEAIFKMKISGVKPR